MYFITADIIIIIKYNNFVNIKKYKKVLGIKKLLNNETEEWEIKWYKKSKLMDEHRL